MRDGEFVEALPPMKESRESPSAVSSGSGLVVAGGAPQESLLCGSVQRWPVDDCSLPTECRPGMQSALHGDTWYLITLSGEYSVRRYNRSYLDPTSHHGRRYLMLLIAVQLLPSLVATSLVRWRRGYGGPTTAIYAFSSSTQSWNMLLIMPLSLGMPTAVVLSKRTTDCEQWC